LNSFINYVQPTKIKQMKKLTFLLATLLIGGMMFTGCKKDNTPGSDPASKTFKVSYALGNKTTAALGIELVTSDCFKFDVTYTGANGEQVEVKGVTLPWTSPSIDVKAPFKAKIEAKPVYDEAQLPDTFAYGAIPSISKDGAVVMTGGEIANRTKVKFLQIMQESPEELIMKTAYDF
jgi:hypothetical protein